MFVNEGNVEGEGGGPHIVFIACQRGICVKDAVEDVRGACTSQRGSCGADLVEVSSLYQNRF